MKKPFITAEISSAVHILEDNNLLWRSFLMRRSTFSSQGVNFVLDIGYCRGYINNFEKKYCKYHLKMLQVFWHWKELFEGMSTGVRKKERHLHFDTEENFDFLEGNLFRIILPWDI